MAGWLLQANRSGGSFGGVVVSSFQCSAVWSFRLSNEARGCCQVAAVSALPFLSFPGGLVLKMAAAAGPGVEELALLEKLLGLPRGNKYGVQGERKVKGARRGRQRPAAREPLLTPPSPTASHLTTSLPPPRFPAPPGVTVAGLTLSPGRAGLVSASAARSRTVALLLERFSLRGFIPSASSFTVPF